MDIEEIKKEILEAYRIHSSSTIYAYFINLGFVKGLARAKAITLEELNFLLEFNAENEPCTVKKKYEE